MLNVPGISSRALLGLGMTVGEVSYVLWVIRLLLITSLFSLLTSQENVVAGVSYLLLLLWQGGRREGSHVGVFQLNSSKSAPRKTVTSVPFLQK